MKYYTYDLWTYDICGNPVEGFFVNNRFKEEQDIVLSEDIVMSDEKLIKAMKDLNIINKDYNESDIDIQGEADDILFFADTSEDNSYLPIFELDCIGIREE